MMIIKVIISRKIFIFILLGSFLYDLWKLLEIYIYGILFLGVMFLQRSAYSVLSEP